MSALLWHYTTGAPPLTHLPFLISPTQFPQSSVTLKIHVYRSDTKSRERNIGGDVMIQLYLWRATLTFLPGETPSFTTCDSA
jgi:hypothetical protein